MRTKTSEILDIIYKDRKILFLFILSTAYFIFQHHVALSWDFSSYVENARYWYSGGMYFEPLRPPLMPFALGISSFVGYRAAEFLYIFIVSALFLYSSIRLADALKFKRTAFYALSLNPFILVIGLINGTELLSVALLELSVAMLIEKNHMSGLFLGLSALARYTGLALFPLLLLAGNAKKIAKSIILFSIPVSIWFCYNYIKSGNLFTSLADQYANNILYRNYLMQPMDPMHFLAVTNLLLPFFLTGLIIIILYLLDHIIKKIAGRKIKREESIVKSISDLISDKKAEIIMLAILIFSIFSYSGIPIKDPRYLFTIVIPVIYISYVGLERLCRISKRSVTMAAIIIFMLSFTLLLFAEATRMEEKPMIKELYYDSPDKYLLSIETLHSLEIENCSLMSNAWVLMNYLGQPSKEFPRREFVEEELEKGEIMLFFFDTGEPDYINDQQFIDTLPVIYRNQDYFILQKTGTCLLQEKQDTTYLEKLDIIVYRQKESHINTDPCIILFGSKPLLERSCNLVNMNGFTLDENRWTGA
ncbi:MAG: hypothetical protein U9O53_01040 [archaeon]|nr:hypothetical protein [archaeon]